jgi:hypothetical protein
MIVTMGLCAPERNATKFPLPARGERVRVRGGRLLVTKNPPLTPALSPSCEGHDGERGSHAHP